jgi:hypothetical protein
MTEAAVAKELGENSGIMSHHLRQLAEFGFAQEISGRGQGRERWWQVAPEPPREGTQARASRQAPASRIAEPGLPASRYGYIHNAALGRAGTARPVWPADEHGGNQ